MSWETNFYYHPEKSALTKVAELELSEPCYSFDLVVAWINGEGDWYIASDSGCSCPTPFENFEGIGDLTGPLTVDQVLEEVTSLAHASYEEEYALRGLPDFLEAVTKAAEKRL